MDDVNLMLVSMLALVLIVELSLALRMVLIKMNDVQKLFMSRKTTQR